VLWVQQSVVQQQNSSMQIHQPTTGGGGGGVLTLDNGLTLSGTTGLLGGVLTQNTDISGDTYAYILTFTELNKFLVDTQLTISLTSSTGEITLDGGAGIQINPNTGGEKLGYPLVLSDLATYGVDWIPDVVVNSITSDTTTGILLQSANGTDIGTLGVGDTANNEWAGTQKMSALTAGKYIVLNTNKILTSVDGETSSFGLMKGARYMAPAFRTSSTSSGTTVWVSGSIYLQYFTVSQTTTVNKLGVRVSVGGTAGSKGRIAIYNVNSSMQPTTTVYAGGDLAVDSAGAKEYTSINTTLVPGNYALAFQHNASSAPSLYGYARAATTQYGVADMIDDSANDVSTAFAYAAFPDLTSATLTYTSRSTLPAIFLAL